MKKLLTLILIQPTICGVIIAQCERTFIDSGQNLGNSNSWGIGLSDLDNDGDLDAYIGNNQNQPDKVWINDGNGTFTDSGQNLDSLSCTDVALGDLDGDVYPDIITANSGGWNIIYYNRTPK